MATALNEQIKWEMYSANLYLAMSAYLQDAGGENLLARQEDPARYSSETISTETLLPLADRADVWIVGDIHAVPPRNPAIAGSFHKGTPRRAMISRDSSARSASASPSATSRKPN